MTAIAIRGATPAKSGSKTYRRLKIKTSKRTTTATTTMTMGIPIDTLSTLDPLSLAVGHLIPGLSNYV